MDYTFLVVLCLCVSSAGARMRSNAILDHDLDLRRQACLEKPLERAEEEANVVFTGTIRGLYTDFEHPDMKKAQVEIKRIFKGQNVVNGMSREQEGYPDPWHRRVIMVDGSGDPHICHSNARKHDTRIFLANKGVNGELKLNSSLVRLTLSNLEHAEAAVKSKFNARQT
jgi:coxsackievirus/adenovirus receptor